MAYNRQIDCVFAFFLKLLGPKKNSINTDAFCASEAQNHGIYIRCCLPLVAKPTVFTVFFGQHLAKPLVFIYAFFGMLQELLFPCQRHKNTVNESVLDLLLGFVKGLRGGI